MTTDDAAAAAAAVAIVRALVDRDRWEQVSQHMTADELAQYERVEGQHAARMRQMGRPGW